MKLIEYTRILGLALLVAAACQAQTTRSRTESSSRASAPDVKASLDRLERTADHFEDRFDKALDSSSYNGTHTEDVLARWADMLEDEIDDMAKTYSNSGKNDEFIHHFENSMLVATAINRAMLRKDFAQAESDWGSLREDLNHIAMQYHRPVLPNVTVITITPATGVLLTKPEVTQVMQQLESSTDRFEDKLKSALHHSTANMTARQRVWNRWADMLEDSSDNMLDEWKDKDVPHFQDNLERTLMVASAVNRLMLRSDLSPEAELEWKTVRGQLNTLAGVFGYPVLGNVIASR